jgi:succinate dehydrogenase / fumarate reductase cytochrome b subunit
MHGWIHASWWIDGVVRPVGGAKFAPYAAASSAGMALQSMVVVVLYVIGVTACVYHLANGIWTMGITWGVWTSTAAQRKAGWVCSAFGVALLAVGLGALVGMHRVGHGARLEEAIEAEDQMYRARLEAGEVLENPEKRHRPGTEERDGETEQESESEHESSEP